MTIVAATPTAIAQAAQLLRDGELVGIPTETVYGLGTDATNPEAVTKIFAAKQRPRFNPLIVHVANLAAAREIAQFTNAAVRLADAFWPGPLTLVLPRHTNDTIPDITVAGLRTIAVRVPSHAVAQELLRTFAHPVAAPSANRSGHVSATSAGHVANDLGAHCALILEAGPSDIGLESTVIDATGAEIAILRSGAISRDKIEVVTGAVISPAGTSGRQPKSPGQLLSHYAPNCHLRMNATTVGENEALLAFGPDAPKTQGPSINLSPSGDLGEAAAGLFAALRELDQPQVACIAVMPIPDSGLGEAINDRLRRAAAAKDSGH